MERCAEYSYIEGLEYDHIILIAEGGGNKKGALNISEDISQIIATI